MTDVYKRLAEKLDGLPNGFPASESGVELKILQRIYTPEEAEMALKLRPIPETPEAISERLGIPLDELQPILDNMVDKGQIGSAKMKGEQVYMVVPFVVGVFEFQLHRLDKEMVDLIEEYGPTLMRTVGEFAPALLRVVPVNLQTKLEQQVLPYEDIAAMMEGGKAFQVVDCICRKESALRGKPCSHSTEVCLAFANHEGAFDKYAKGRVISKQEALEILAKAEDEGLVHNTYNVRTGQMFVCNCCSCCCGIMRGVKEFKAPYLMAKSNFVAAIDQEACAACGVCADERCPMEAIVEDNGSYKVLAERCIGCGVCTPTCPTDSIKLERRPEAAQTEPPNNIVEWYFQRAANRGIQLRID
ncbi:MAG: 4Fe-4S binding protein [Thermodesulfobacteriota bacterium]